MNKLRFHHLKPTPGSTKRKLRKGRGEAGKRGKTAGRGTKGTGARKTVPAYFEGGQIPLYRRIPKLKGIGNGPKMSYVVVNVSDLQEKNISGDVDPDTLRNLGLLNYVTQQIVCQKFVAGSVHKIGFVKVLVH